MVSVEYVYSFLGRSLQSCQRISNRVLEAQGLATPSSHPIRYVANVFLGAHVLSSVGRHLDELVEEGRAEVHPSEVEVHFTSVRKEPFLRYWREKARYRISDNTDDTETLYWPLSPADCVEPRLTYT